MSSYHDVEGNIKQILNTFDTFVTAYETNSWLKNASVDDIKNVFKMALFVEKAIRCFEGKGCLKQFMESLGVWWKEKNRTRMYDINFFNLACDQLLIKLLTSKQVTLNVSDIVVRIYTAMFPKERFEHAITNLILMGNTYETILDFLIVNNLNLNLKQLEAQLVVNNWAKQLQMGHNVRNLINDALCNYKIERTLLVLIAILTVQNVHPQENEVRNLIVLSLEAKMLDRSVLSKKFWLALLKTIDASDLILVCSQYRTILDSVMNFLVYIGSMMNHEENSNRWIADSKVSICPEITFDDLFTFIKRLYTFNEEIKKIITERITVAQRDTGSKLWLEILADM